ncbi:hypothetical protein FRB90_012450, partial [Tulasnella sp. 427]
RMPNEIGTFVSVVMYNRQLRSNHAYNISGFDCVKFVDVAVGEEEVEGTSWVNKDEAEAIVQLVRNYYSDLAFVVITPYDSQRKLIEKKLESDGLPGKGKCFNVDSFQGNEEDYVLISCVRTSKTGFLDLHNRINVMLTRAQRGMVIVTKREFVRRIAKNTLVGRLSQTWGNKTDLDAEDGFYTDDEEVEEAEEKQTKSDSDGGSEAEAQAGAHWVYYSDVKNNIEADMGFQAEPVIVFQLHFLEVRSKTIFAAQGEMGSSESALEHAVELQRTCDSNDLSCAVGCLECQTVHRCLLEQ